MNITQLSAALAIIATVSAALTGITSLSETASGQNATTAGGNLTGGNVTIGNATTPATAVGPATSESGQSKEERYDEGWE